MDWLVLVLLGLATWRLSHLLVVEDGPFMICAKIREWTGIRVNDGIMYWPLWNPLTCVWCTSIWMAIVMWFAWMVAYWLVWILAVSAICCLIESRREVE